MRSVLKFLAIALLLFPAAIAHSQTFPDRPVNLVVGFPAGTSVDIVARLVGQKLSTLWGQPVLVENCAGAGGNIGAGFVARSNPDGYTILLGNNGVAISATLYRKLSYNLAQDLKGVTKVSSQPFVLVVAPNLPVHSIKDLIALAKSKPHQLNFASAGVGNADHLAGELFAHMGGIDMVHVPYQGGTNAMTDIVGGYMSMYFSGIASALPFIKNNQLRALGTSGPRRSPALPDVPTISEGPTGLPGYEVTLWSGFLAPSGTPQNVIDKIAADTAQVLKMPDVRDRFAALGLDATPTSSVEYQAFLKSEVDKWGGVIKAIGLSLE